MFSIDLEDRTVSLQTKYSPDKKLFITQRLAGFVQLIIDRVLLPDYTMKIKLFAVLVLLSPKELVAFVRGSLGTFTPFISYYCVKMCRNKVQ